VLAADAAGNVRVGGGGVCVTAATSGGSIIEHMIVYALFNLALIGLSAWAFMPSTRS
jgi:hypothetical protein